jgi:hypothetical protein
MLLGPSLARWAPHAAGAGAGACIRQSLEMYGRARLRTTRKLWIRGTSTSIKPTDAHEGGGSGTLAIGCSESSAVPVQMWHGASPVPDADVAWSERSPRAAVAGASPVPVQMWRADHDEAALKTSSV